MQLSLAVMFGKMLVKKAIIKTQEYAGTKEGKEKKEIAIKYIFNKLSKIPFIGRLCDEQDEREFLRAKFGKLIDKLVPDVLVKL